MIRKIARKFNVMNAIGMDLGVASSTFLTPSGLKVASTQPIVQIINIIHLVNNRFITGPTSHFTRMTLWELKVEFSLCLPYQIDSTHWKRRLFILVWATSLIWRNQELQLIFVSLKEKVVLQITKRDFHICLLCSWHKFLATQESSWATFKEKWSLCANNLS